MQMPWLRSRTRPGPFGRGGRACDSSASDAERASCVCRASCCGRNCRFAGFGGMSRCNCVVFFFFFPFTFFLVFQLDVQACCWHVVAMFRLAFYVKVSFFSSILFTRISTALGTFTFKVPLYQGRIIGLPWWFRWAHPCCFGRNDGPFTSPSA